MDREGLSRAQELRAIAAIGGQAGDAEALSQEDLLRGYSPNPAHVHIYDPDRILLVGGRGVGKTELFRILSLPGGSDLVAAAVGHSPPRGAALIRFIETFSPYRPGQGGPDVPPYPAVDVIEAVLRGGDEQDQRRRARLLWLALTVSALSRSPLSAKEAGQPHLVQALLAEVAVRANSLRTLYDFIAADPERPYQVLDALEQNRRHCVFTFDGLERVAETLVCRDPFIAGLLSLALDLLRRYRWLRFKIFLRPDYESAAALAFPDASRLQGYRLSLDWDIAQLNRLLLRQIVNLTEEGNQVRRQLFPDLFRHVDRLGWIPTEAMDLGAQERAIHVLCGKYLGRDPRTGRTEDWIYQHLGDAHKRTTPRSILLAFRAAAEEAQKKPEKPGPPCPPLGKEDLHHGVRCAALRRVAELIEDHPWLNRVTPRLQGLLVPCDEIELRERLGEDADKLELLEFIGVFSKPGKDRRRNVPDLYRLALGIKRKGGIRLPI